MKLKFTSLAVCSLLVIGYLGITVNGESDRKGHLKPLGEAGSLSETRRYDGFPPLKTFFNDFVWKSIPLVMKGAAKSFPAFSAWSDEYLLSHPETETWKMFVEKRKKENRSLGGVDSTFKEFLLRYNTTDEYLIANVPGFLK